MRPFTALSIHTLGFAWTFAAGGVAAQTTFFDPNTLPALTCAQPEYKGPKISFAGAPSGKGANDVVPSLGPLHPDVRGRAQWTYTAPNDGINRVKLAVALPDALAAQYNVAYVPAGSGFNPSYPTEFRVSVVGANVDGTKINSSTPITDPVLAATVHQVVPTDVRTSAIATTIDAQVAAGAVWSVVIQEARNVATPTANNPNWVQTLYVCKLTVDALL